MKYVNGAAFRKRMAQHLDECEKTGDPVLVTTYKKETKSYQRMVVISEEQYTMTINKINEAKNG